MFLLRPMIADDRGKPFPLVQQEFRSPGGENAGRWRRLEEAKLAPQEPWTAKETRRWVLWGLLTGPAIIVMATAPALMTSVFHLPAWAIFGGSVLTGLMPMTIVLLITRNAGGRRIARQYVRAGYCGSCGYDIVGVDAGDDGCRICPECGAAWRV
jgi:hypothetical protein